MSAIAAIARFSILGAALALAYVCYNEYRQNRRRQTNAHQTSCGNRSRGSRSESSGQCSSEPRKSTCRPAPQPSDDCPICLCQYSAPLEILPCNHLFHRNCLRKWFQRQWFCPICTLEIEGKIREEYESRLDLAPL